MEAPFASLTETQVHRHAAMMRLLTDISKCSSRFAKQRGNQPVAESRSKGSPGVLQSLSNLISM
jgi:hypothetical protein